MRNPFCTCGVAMGVAIVVGHMCPVHYRESFLNGQHPLHEHVATPARAAFAWVASGQQQVFDPNDDDVLTGYYSTHGD